MRIGIIVWLVSLTPLVVPALEAVDWQDKVDPWVLDSARSSRQTDFLVFLSRQADVSGAARLATKREKGRYVLEQLRRTAEITQAPVRAALESEGVEYRSFWIANMIWVRGSESVVKSLAVRSDVAHIYANPRVQMELPVPRAQSSSATAVEDSIQHTRAPSVFWKKGYRGQGIVIAGQDTGYDWEHPALRSSYRGWSGSEADHNYSWHDAIHSGGGACGADSREPCDDSDHGTHTMGTMVGDDGAGNRIGMAPGAQWIGCRNMDLGVGTPATYTECFQWFLAPTDLDDRNPDPDRAPDVISNSWTCPPFEGCTNPNALKKVVRNVRAAGIVIVVAAGNEGASCSSIKDPPAIYGAALTVGATNNEDKIAGFSSRGPVRVDGSNRLKPDVSAPGVDVRSSVPGGGYGRSSGTSMATPHVAGLVALTLSAANCLRGDVGATEDSVIATSVPRTTDKVCGNVPGSKSPNNVYGFGTIRAALPDCGDQPVSGLGTGVEIERVVCHNRTANQKVTVAVGRRPTWDCEAEGMPARVGDRLQLQVSGRATLARAVGASVAGFRPTRAICKNLTTGKKRTIRLKGTTAWDCQAKGLQVDTGDEIKQTITGKIKKSS